MIEIVTALWPVFALLLIGHMMRRIHFPGDAFWPSAEKLTYFLLFPALLVDRLASADLSAMAISPLFSVIVAALLLGSLLSVLLQHKLQLDGASFTSFYQGNIRFNTYVGLAVTSILFGVQGIAVAALAAGLMIPLINLLCILVFARYVGVSGSFSGLLKTIVLNPLIVACCIGLLLNFSGLGLPVIVASLTELLGQMALPMGLLAVGAGLSFSSMSVDLRAQFCSIVVKLLLMPGLVWLITTSLAVDELIRAILVLLFAMPTAPSGFILARQLGGNGKMIASLITLQTLLAMFSLPLWLLLVM